MTAASLTADEVFELALQLSDEEREELLHLLVGACSPPDPEWWASIEPEMEARIAAMESGETESVPLQDVRKWLFERVSATTD